MLIKLFGCEYRGGRAESAPLLRKKEKEEEEVHANEEDEVSKAGLVERAVLSEDFPWYNDFPTHDPDVLPHEYEMGDLDSYFPTATAPDAVDDDDADADDWNLIAPDPHDVIKHHNTGRMRRS